MSFLLLLVYGTINLCLFMTTKQVADLAAFGAARTAMVRGVDEVELGLFGLEALIGVRLPLRAQIGYLSAAQVLFHTQRWWREGARNLPDFPLGVERPSLEGDTFLIVPYRVPYGMPIFSQLPQGGVLVEGRSPLVVQADRFVWRPWDE